MTNKFILLFELALIPVTNICVMITQCNFFIYCIVILYKLQLFFNLLVRNLVPVQFG